MNLWEKFVMGAVSGIVRQLLLNASPEDREEWKDRLVSIAKEIMKGYPEEFKKEN